MRYLWIIPIALIVVMFLGCSGKTTVHEEMINTTESEENKDNTGQQLSDEIQKAADDEKVKQEEESGKEEEKPEKRPAPGQEKTGDSDKRTPAFPATGPSNNQGHSKEDRERYMNNNMTYPGSQPIEGFQPSGTSSHTSVTLLTNDSPDQVSLWYQTQFAGDAQVNQRGDKFNPEYHITVNDKANGYKTNLIISKSGGQGQTRIIVSVKDL
ncbi:hypothetical protein J7L05_00115 [bacterium]|nr:hypothetical protein [bacterium]